MKKIIYLIASLVGLSVLSSCQKYLDVVPDNIATLEDAFSSRIQAEKSLFTCYSYLPAEGDPQVNPAMLTSDEFWLFPGVRGNSGINPNGWYIALGEQGLTSPLLNYWDGENGGKPLFRGIRDCNIFIEKIMQVRDINSYERDKWIGEAMFLKAYYHFYLLRMYGPIPIVDKNLPIYSTPEEVRVARRPVDECVDYIVKTLDEAALLLPEKVDLPLEELGRITKPIALSIKARVLLMAASPLFNGNSDFASMKNKDGQILFNQAYDASKWERALKATQDAIDLAESVGVQLYKFQPTIITGPLSQETTRILSLQNAVTERWNSEIIWGLTNNDTRMMQSISMARLQNNYGVASSMAPTHRMVELFYTKNGVPISEDKNLSFTNRNDLRAGTAAEKFYIKQGYQTARINFEREPRFYADMAFDGGIWYGIGKYADGGDVWYVQGKFGQNAGRRDITRFSSTGYWPKKLVNYLTTQAAGGEFSTQRYTWPVMRLADLYLMHAESSNEVNGPNADTFKYLDRIRERAGLKDVMYSWSNFSTEPSKPATKEGMRSIIRQERMIEMAFEGSRFWDLRRWKEAPTVYNGPIKGWDIEQKDAVNYYREKVLDYQTFQLKDYFWPVKDNNILVNSNLIQNIGW
ncbi:MULTISPECIES: RagB/SusD family nutrient uptake outer membrane protein [Sphingobacterium]|uniref:RagB/SusD family nutrient uptake outer membrane protein n=1 Tax=Sphingobacterium TaxID=28453 RepID=UPI0013D97C2D|nr:MULTISPECIES: RagB/SusD family nutrient uptake outer membrane protein [unclassified Sphingobacterium]